MIIRLSEKQMIDFLIFFDQFEELNSPIKTEIRNSFKDYNKVSETFSIQNKSRQVVSQNLILEILLETEVFINFR